MQNPPPSSADEDRLRQIDDAVCRVAHSGTCDPWHPYRFKRTLSLDPKHDARIAVEASFRTGARTASVRHNQHGLVYETKNNGTLTCFRKGKWLEALEALAFDLETEAWADQALREGTEQLEHEQRFEPLDD